MLKQGNILNLSWNTSAEHPNTRKVAYHIWQDFLMATTESNTFTPVTCQQWELGLANSFDFHEVISLTCFVLYHLK